MIFPGATIRKRYFRIYAHLIGTLNAWNESTNRLESLSKRVLRNSVHQIPKRGVWTDGKLYILWFKIFFTHGHRKTTPGAKKLYSVQKLKSANLLKPRPWWKGLCTIQSYSCFRFLELTHFMKQKGKCFEIITKIKMQTDTWKHWYTYFKLYKSSILWSLLRSKWMLKIRSVTLSGIDFD